MKVEFGGKPQQSLITQPSDNKTTTKVRISCKGFMEIVDYRILPPFLAVYFRV